MIDLSTIIPGIITVTDLIYKLKGLKSNKVKALISMDSIIINRECIACRISISNMGDKPFSIIDIFIIHKEEKYSGLAIRDIIVSPYGSGGGGYTLKADMTEINFNANKDIMFNLNAFDFDKFLQPNQAETGWIIFSLTAEDLMLSSMGIKISGETEIFQTFDT